MRACWSHLAWFDDGSWRLFIPFSKTNQLGEGEFVFVSRRTMAALDTMRELSRIFQVKKGAIDDRVRFACALGGLVGRFGSQSMRIGMAQDLAVSGFSLPLIMRAGRRDGPKMPALYIRNLKVSESAVAQLHKMWASDLTRVDRTMDPYDVLSSYHAVHFGT